MSISLRQRDSSNGQWAHDEALRSTNHYGNINQNHHEMPFLIRMLTTKQSGHTKRRFGGPGSLRTMDGDPTRCCSRGQEYSGSLRNYRGQPHDLGAPVLGTQLQNSEAAS